VAELNVFKSRDRKVGLPSELEGEVFEVHHWITGDEFSTAVPETISLVMSSLLKGSLLYAMQHKCGTLCNPPSDWGVEREQAYYGCIRPLVADTRLFRKWKVNCCSMHHECREMFGKKQAKRLMHWDAAVHRFPLIDVKMCIIDGKVNMSYTALSRERDEFRLMPKLTTENHFRRTGSLRSEMQPPLLRRFRSCLKVL
jgi:hypothetical protein